jgi:peptidoglycan/xylan/chitin deacetylase (PgdA/CDA1 family)
MKVVITLLIALISLDFAQNRIALTFDDGPCSNGNSLLDEIEKAGVPATFFLIGQNVAGNEAQVKRAAGIGDIGCHGWGYDSNPSYSDIQRNIQAVSNAGGNCKFFRCPNLEYGSCVQSAQTAGVALIGTDVIGQDWNSISTSQVVSNIVIAAHNGGIALLHWPNTAPETVQAVGQIVTQLKAKNYSFATVSQLCGNLSAGKRVDSC